MLSLWATPLWDKQKMPPLRKKKIAYELFVKQFKGKKNNPTFTPRYIVEGGKNGFNLGGEKKEKRSAVKP